MIKSRLLNILSVVSALAGGAVATDGQSATINLDTGKTASVSPGASGAMTFSVTNVDAGNVTDFLGWVMGFQLIPAGGNTGTLSSGSLTAATSDPMPVGTVSVSQPSNGTLGTAINSTLSFQSMGIDSTDTLGTVVSGNSYNLGTLAFTASGDASGAWTVFAVQENSPGLKTYYLDGSANPTQFGNLAFGQGSVGLALGTITVTPVPEPSTAGLLVVALGAASIVRRRNRRQRGRVEPKKESKTAFSGSHGVGV